MDGGRSDIPVDWIPAIRVGMTTFCVWLRYLANQVVLTRLEKQRLVHNS